MATIAKLAGSIALGQSISNPVNIGTNYVVGLVMPAAWTPARMTVSVSTDNVAYNDLFQFDADCTTASEFKFNVTPNAIVAVDPDKMLMARYIKLRSGTRDEPVPQAALRLFYIITVNAVTVQQASVELADETDRN